jgi:cAMP phosphodiesterase
MSDTNGTRAAGEAALVGDMLDDIRQLRGSSPDYFAYFEDVDPDTCSRSDLYDLMHSAPNERVRFFLLGKYTMRISIASITGREFK